MVAYPKRTIEILEYRRPGLDYNADPSNVSPIVGESQNNVAAGLSMPSCLFLNNKCVKLHRRALSALALMTEMNPPSIR